MTELEHRLTLWHTLLRQDGTKHVKPQVLRDLGIYGGAQGVWVDKSRTGELTADGTGITVSLLHKGSTYPDDLSEDGVLYHYPHTRRPASRDISEIEATKAAGKLGIPVFVITCPTPSSTFRDVHLGWVEGWDDDAETFLISFCEEPPATLLTDPIDDKPFELLRQHTDKKASTTTRPNQQLFRFLTIQRYGPKCAVCDLDILPLLDAVHIVPRSLGGTDDPRNGLVLCALHHRAFDAGMFTINPHTLEICCPPEGPQPASLKITRESITHLTRLPHIDALEWIWRNSE